jgi:hypothetical protein
LQFLRAHRSCTGDTVSRQAALQQVNELGPALAVGQTVHLKDKSANRYLGTGWSQQESWGVWSDADQANLVFLARSPPGADRLRLRVTFRPYVRPSVGRQTISVSVNGHSVDMWTISKEMLDKECCERSIALGRDLPATDEIDVTFHISDPRNPDADREIADSRHLGLMLQSMTLIDSSGSAR